MTRAISYPRPTTGSSFPPRRPRAIEAEILDDTPVLPLLLPAFLCIFSAWFVLRPGNAVQQSFITHVAQQTAIVHTMLAKIGLAVILRGAAKSQQKIQGTRFGDPLPGGFQHGDAQDVLGVTGERGLVRFRVRYRLVCEYVAVDEPLETVRSTPRPTMTLQAAFSPWRRISQNRWSGPCRSFRSSSPRPWRNGLCR